MSKALDRGDLGAVLHDGEREAGNDPASVHQHRAGAALAVIAALFRARQVEAVPQGIEQGRPRRDGELMIVPVDVERDGHRGWAGGRSRLRVT